MATEVPHVESTGSLDVKAFLNGFVIARNASAIREFSATAGIGHDELRELLKEVLAEQEAVGKEIRLGLRYDIHTARYSTLAEFVDRVASDL